MIKSNKTSNYTFINLVQFSMQLQGAEEGDTIAVLSNTVNYKVDREEHSIFCKYYQITEVFTFEDFKIGFYANNQHNMKVSFHFTDIVDYRFVLIKNLNKLKPFNKKYKITFERATNANEYDFFKNHKLLYVRGASK